MNESGLMACAKSYEIIIKRRYNGQIMAVFSFTSERELSSVLDFIIQKNNLQPLPKIKRRLDDAWSAPDSKYILIARPITRTAVERALQAATRAFGGVV